LGFFPAVDADEDFNVAQIQLFELIDALEPGKKAKALLLKWDGNRYTARGAKPILVHSFSGTHGLSGDRGYCFLGDSHRWEVVGPLVSEHLSG
jgi:hypothetical protein